MLAYSEARFGLRRSLGYLIAFWLGAVALLAILTQHKTRELGLPTSLGQTLYVAFWWLVPGLVLGGWKAILVVAGKSAVSRRRDRIFIQIFKFWVVGWTILAFTLTFSRLGTL